MIEKRGSAHLLSELIDSAEVRAVHFGKISDISDLEFFGASENSKNVGSGDIFVAIKGHFDDGAKYVKEAIDNGAVAIACCTESFRDIVGTFDVPVLEVDDTRLFLSKISKITYKKQPEFLSAVTGTNGKSSIVDFCRQIWTLLGNKAASIGTLGCIGHDYFDSTDLTTPSSAELHKRLSFLHDTGVKFVAIEASSLGIVQHRLTNVEVNVAAFSSFSEDHLDIHFNIEDYWESKAKLFKDILKDGGCAILNCDVMNIECLKDACQKKNIEIITYGNSDSDMYVISGEIVKKNKQIVKVCIFGKQYTFTLPFLGSFQVDNVLCAIAIVHKSGFQIDEIVDVLEELYCVPGRMQAVLNTNIYVDYAHNEKALKFALDEVRKFSKGKIGVVFGCGGQRDSLKRPKMGETASIGADFVVITDDNPRNEDSGEIRKAIILGCKNSETKIFEIQNRAEAITFAIDKLGKDDCLLIAGKGHENYQIIKGERIHFSDFDVARDYLELKRC